MPKITASAFKGLLPSVAETLLPDGAAQVAVDCDLSGGSLRPYKANSLQASPATANEVKSIHYYTDKNGARFWLFFENLVNVERGHISNDTTSRIYYTGDGAPKVTDSDRLLQTPNHYLLGVPAPVSAPVASVGAAGASPTDRTYVVTYVTAWGEESAPSLPSAIVSVGAGGSVDLTLPLPLNNTDHNPVTKIYIYRTVTGDEGGAYRFVAEVSHLTANYTDSTNDADLPPDLLQTADYLEPPADLFGLTSLDNGCMVAFRDYEVCLSEPFQPHAWPNGYRYASKDKIVGGGVFGNRIVVVTDRHPFILYGTDPANMSPSNIEEVIPCVSAAGIVSGNGGVMFPSADGLWFIGQGGVRNLTTQIYTPEDWAAIKPEEFVAELWDEKYIAFTSEKGYLFDLNQMDRHTFIAEAASAVHVDSISKDLYFNVFESSANRIYRFNGSNINRVFQWKSKEHFNMERISFSAGRVYAKYFGLTQAEADAMNAAYDSAVAANQLLFAGGNENSGVNQGFINEFTINGNDMQDLPERPPNAVVHIKFWADGILVSEQDVIDRQIFRMPIGYRANVFEFEISSPLEVGMVQFATSARELAA